MRFTSAALVVFFAFGLGLTGVACSKVGSNAVDSGVLAAANPSLPSSGGIIATCHGNEPFWGLQIDSGYLSLKDQSGHLGNLTIKNTGAQPAAGTQLEYISFYQGRTLENQSRYLNVIVEKKSCNDSTSEKTFSHSVLVLSGNQLLKGCCTLE